MNFHKSLLLATTGLCVFFSSSVIHGQELPFVLDADNIEYDLPANLLIASGNVEVVSSQGALQADKVTYNTQTEQITASGDVLFLDENKAAIYVDNIELSGKFEQAAANVFRMRLLEHQNSRTGPALTAKKATKKGDIYTLKNATYSACPVQNNAKAPWQIRSQKINFDTDKEVVSYQNNWFDIYGMPLLWLPYMQHTTNFDDPRSGFLPPSIGSSSDLGQELTLSYYYHLNEQEDFTLRERYMTKKGFQTFLEHRFNSIHSNGDIRTSFINDKETDEFRWHVIGNGEWVTKPGNRFGFNTRYASDDAFFDEFLRENPAYLPSVAYFENAGPWHYFGINSTYYRDLRDGRSDSQTALPLANIQFDKVFTSERKGEQLSTKFNMLALHRDEGDRMQRFVTETNYSLPFTFNSGDMLEVSANLRADLYHLDAIEDESSWAGRAFPSAALFWQKPMISPEGRHVLTPMVKAIIAPKDGNPDEIPNEDSVAFELDASNLFETNRFAGLDRIETGPRLIYGLRNDWISDKNSRTLATVFLGQSLRRYDDPDLPETGGIGSRFSDWIGFINLRPTETLSAISRFRLDHKSFKIRRIDNSIRFGNTANRVGNYFKLTHTYVENGPEEANAEIGYMFNDHWFSRASVKRDLTSDGEELDSSISLGYRHCCYTIELSLSRRQYNNRDDIEPSTDLNLNFELLTLGRNID